MKKKKDEILQTKSVAISVCEHGSLTVGLYDADGKLFAIAQIPSEEVMGFVEDIFTGYEGHALKVLGDADSTRMH